MGEIIKLIEENKIDEAIELIIAKEAEFKNDSEYWAVRGFISTSVGVYDVAISCYEKAKELDSKDCDMYYNYGYTCEQLGRKSDAARNYALSCIYGINDELAEELHEKYSSNSYIDKIFKTTLENASNITQDVYCLIDLFDSNGSNKVFHDKLLKYMPNVKYICSDRSCNVSGLKNVSLKDLKKQNDIKPIIIWTKDNYIKQVRYLADNNFSCCTIAAPKIDYFELVNIRADEMHRIKNKEYLSTISVCRRHASDANVDAVLRYIPENMKKYKFNFIEWDDRYSLASMIKVPLLSSVTLNGFGVFSAYPKHDHVKNIELWHAGLGVKAIGLLDKKDPNASYWADTFKNVDKFCIASEMNKVLYTSLFAIPVDKYAVTGLARNDMLLQPNSKERLEKILGIPLLDKKIIFNLPTFHFNENCNRVEGSKDLQDNFKIENFDYEAFDKFLDDMNAICISKPHYAEEKLISAKNVGRKYKNTYFISNNDLDAHNINMYDVLAAGDLLITDYSSVAGDFIYMNKPIVFVTTDIDEYRENKGFTLEPFDFWNPGEKVQTQKDLQLAIQDGLYTPEKYSKKRKELLPVFYNNTEFGSSYKVWEVIDSMFKSISK